MRKPRHVQKLGELRDGSLKKSMFKMFQLRGSRGHTEPELRCLMGRSFDAVAKARESLTGDDLIQESGEVREGWPVWTIRNP